MKNIKQKTWLELFSELVEQELTEMKRLGVKVPNKSIEMSKNKKIMKEYVSSMNTSECADLLITLGQIR